MKKFLKLAAIVLALVIVFAYAFGYDYLFSGITKTYLRGETSATITDGSLFPSRDIRTERPKAWKIATNYNKTELPKNLVQDLVQTKTAAFVVIHHGELLHEEYWDGFSKTSKTNSFSMAKSITALLLGAAIDEGKIKSENQLVSNFLPSYANRKLGNTLTLKNLTTMEAGLNWNESYYNPFAPNAKAYYGNSLGKSIFPIDFKNKPGTKFEYQSGSTQLLGFAIREAVQEPLASYAAKKLWTPLGMEQNAYWSTDDSGMEKTFCCIHSNARDFAKLGQMMLSGGMVDSVQVITKGYLDRMITPTKESNGAYGYGIWINQDAKYKHYYFWGILGQYTIVVPEKNLVIVRLGSNENIISDTKGRPTQVDFIVNQIVDSFLKKD